MTIFRETSTERVSVIEATSAQVSASTIAKTVRLVGTVAFNFARSVDATQDTSVYVPADTPTFIIVAKGDVLSFISATSAGNGFVFVSDVHPA